MSEPHDPPPEAQEAEPGVPEPRGDKRHRFLVTIAGVALLVLAFVFAFALGVDFEAVRAGVETAWAHLKSAPAPIYFGIMAVVIAAPVPATFLYLTAGPIYGILPSLLWIALALALNALLVHALASGWLRPRLERLVARRGLKVPRFESARDQKLFILLVRITPGIPYFVQSWVIALADVERIPFLWITVLVQMFYATGFVVLGRSAFEGEVGLAVGAGILLVVVGVVARIVHKRFRNAPLPGAQQD